MKPEDAIHSAPFGGADEPVMSNPYGVKRCIDFAPPVIEENKQPREVRSQIIFLPDIDLQQRRRIGPVIADFGKRKSIAL